MQIIGSSFLLICVLLLSGCASKVGVCPQYPAPTKDVLKKIQSLKDKNVDNWIVKQFKLNKQLKICNE